LSSVAEEGPLLDGTSLLENLGLQIDVNKAQDPGNCSQGSGREDPYCKHDETFLPLSEVKISDTTEQTEIQYQSRNGTLVTNNDVI
jgi:hypothetical protein